MQNWQQLNFFIGVFTYVLLVSKWFTKNQIILRQFPILKANFHSKQTPCLKLTTKILQKCLELFF